MARAKDFSKFERTLDQKTPPENWSNPLKALWWDAKGDWDRAHDLVDGASMPMAHAVHAYLHRKEGDEWNAGYWYRQAGQPYCKLTLNEEFENLVRLVKG